MAGEWIRFALDWAWALILAFGGWLYALSKRVALLEKETLSEKRIDEKLDRLEAHQDKKFASLTAQRADLKAEIHNMNATNATSHEKLYDKIDSLRTEVFKAIVVGRRRGDNDD